MVRISGRGEGHRHDVGLRERHCIAADNDGAADVSSQSAQPSVTIRKKTIDLGECQCCRRPRIARQQQHATGKTRGGQCFGEAFAADISIACETEEGAIVGACIRLRIGHDHGLQRRSAERPVLPERQAADDVQPRLAIQQANPPGVGVRGKRQHRDRRDTGVEIVQRLTGAGALTHRRERAEVLPRKLNEHRAGIGVADGHRETALHRRGARQQFAPDTERDACGREP